MKSVGNMIEICEQNRFQHKKTSAFLRRKDWRQQIKLWKINYYKYTLTGCIDKQKFFYKVLLLFTIDLANYSATRVKQQNCECDHVILI